MHSLIPFRANDPLSAAGIEEIVAFLKSQHVGSAPVQFSPDQVRKALVQAARRPTPSAE